jgi:succinyl-diaminopimelate desuccinylase
VPVPLAETLLWLCRIPSPIGEEQQICDAVEKRLSSARLAGPVRRYGNSLVVPLTRATGGPHIALIGHLDVVRTEHDGAPRIEGDRLYGAGSADMKSGLTLLLRMAEERIPDHVDLTLVFYAREEGPYAENELGVVLDRDPELAKVDLAVALEPSDNKLQLGCGGSIHASVVFEGRTSHSARPWEGDNAIHKAAGVLARLGAREPQPVTVDGLVYYRVMSATLAQGGRARNVIPDRFQLNVNFRFGPDLSLNDAQSEVLTLVGNDARVEFVDLAPSAPPHKHHPLVRALAESGVSAVEPKQAWTDVARFAALGVPAVNFGPGVQAQAHQKNEWTSIASLERGAIVFDEWFERIPKAR